jgi:hypothetical protein
VFALSDIEQFRNDCFQPSLVGELEGNAREGKSALNNLRFVESSTGKLHV